jgi:hypothetical protein
MILTNSDSYYPEIWMAVIWLIILIVQLYVDYIDMVKNYELTMLIHIGTE